VIRPRSPRRLFVVAAAGMLALAACSVGRPAAAVVDGERITDAQLQQDVVLFRYLALVSQSTCGHPIQGESSDAACARATLSSLIQEDLVKHYAVAHGVTASESDVNALVTQLQSSIGGSQPLAAQLKSSGLTLADFRAFASRLALFRQSERAIAAGRLTEDQLMQAYRQNIAEFTKLHVAHILVKTRTEAIRIARIATPQNFADLAKRYSTDSSNAKHGGDLGTIAQSDFTSQFDPDFVRATLALHAGQISAPVHTQFGWHLIDLIGKDVQPFVAVRQQLVDQLGGDVFGRWLRQRLLSASITVNPKYGHLDTATGEVLPIRSTDTDVSPGPVGASASP